MTTRTLLAFATDKDPSFICPVRDDTTPGPLLCALEQRRFDRVVILWRPRRRIQAERSVDALRKLFPKLGIDLEPVEIEDAHHHPEIWTKLRHAVRRIRARAPQHEFSVLLGDDSAEIHANWVLLMLSGELQAKLLNFKTSLDSSTPAVLREVRWRDPAAKLDPGTQALILSDSGPGLYGEAAIVQTGKASERIFTTRSIESAAQLAKSSTPILIQAEPGTQKTLFAAMLHQMSRRSGPLVFFNCSTVSDELAAGALFGEIENGELVPGKMHVAEGGTLVLYKFHKLAGALQLAVLQASEEGEFNPIGSRTRQRCNTRICVTTELDLAVEVTGGNLNAEVFRRLRGGLVRLPSLRERLDELPVLIRDEIDRVNRSQPRPKRLNSGAIAKMEAHHWPSNLSELRRVIEQAFLNSKSTTVEPDDIEFDLSTNIDNHMTLPSPRIRKGFSIETYLRNVKSELIQIALRKNHNNQSKAARMLGITPQAVNKFLQNQNNRSGKKRN
jgi:DNA-binding NtrC family response regulator